MNAQRLSILGAAAVVVLAAGIWLSNRQSGASQDGAPTTLYPALKSELNATQSVSLYTPGDVHAVELVRTAAGWTVSQRAGYPADDTKLRKLLTDIADAKIYEEKTSTPANYPSLGVEDVSDAKASGIRIDVKGPAVPVSLIVGKQASGGRSHYVRRAGEAQSWLIDKSLDTSATPDAWLRKEILDVTADRVQAASVAIGATREYTAEKASRAAADFTVGALPKGKELSSAAAANTFATALAGLTLTDVKPAAEFNDQPAARATIRTFDGLVVQLSGWKRGEDYYLAATPSYDAALAKRFEVPTEPPKEGASAPEQKRPDVAAEVTQAAQRLSGWVYEIPQYKYDAIFKPLDELLKK